MSDDPVFEAWIETARAVSVRLELERRGLWKRSMLGDAGVPCPGCGGRDRFAVNLKKNLFFCRQSGIGGDAIALARHIDGTSFVQAVETIVGAPPPDRAATETAGERAARVDRLEREALARAKKAQSDANAAAKFREWERKAARALWLDGKPLVGTLGEIYLARRGLVAPPEARLRFHARVPFYASSREHDSRDFHVRPIHNGPCILAAIQNAAGVFIGVQRKWIDLDTSDGKLWISDPKTGVILGSKKTKGSKKGGTIRLAGHPVDLGVPSGAVDFYLGEGIETVLSVYTVLDAADRAQAEFHAGVDLGNISGKANGRVPHPTATTCDAKGRGRRLFVPDDIPAPEDDTPLIGIPDSVRRLFLLGDGDSEPFATGLALQRAARRFSAAHPHLEIRLAMARQGTDFNTMLMEAA